jgi:hypothetical protein
MKTAIVFTLLGVKGSGMMELDIFDRNGINRIKLGAGEDGSGLLLIDDARQPAVQIIARQTGTAEKPNTTGITLWGKDGQQRVIRP